MKVYGYNIYKKYNRELDVSHCDHLTFFQYSGRTDREIRARKDLDKYRQNFSKTDNFFPFIYLYPNIDGLKVLCSRSKFVHIFA